MSRSIKGECMGGGGVEVLSSAEQSRAWWRCTRCGRVLKLRKGASGWAAQEALIPRHADPALAAAEKRRAAASAKGSAAGS